MLGSGRKVAQVVLGLAEVHRAALAGNAVRPQIVLELVLDCFLAEAVGQTNLNPNVYLAPIPVHRLAEAGWVRPYG
jgi:hypothetical protein